MSLSLRQKIGGLLLLALCVLLPLHSSVYAADLDGDGVSDIEEVQEYGTDPLTPDIAGVQASAEIRVASLPQEFSLVGKTLLMTGYAPRQAGAVEFTLQSGTGDAVSVLRLTPDSRGVFTGLWDLGDVCHDRGTSTYDIMIQGEPRYHIHLLCDAFLHGFPFTDTTFSGQPLDPEHIPALHVATGDQAIFEAQGKPGFRLYAVYSSVVFSKDLFADETGKNRVVPWKPLPAGHHTLYVMPYDPVHQLLYEPLVLPFDVESGFGENLKANIYYAPGAISIILLVFGGSVLYIRKIRQNRRGIRLEGDLYPDE